MNNIRLLTNAALKVSYLTGDKTLNVASGKFLPARKLVENQDNTVNVELNDGGVIKGLEKKYFSIQGQLIIEKASPKVSVLKNEEPALSKTSTISKPVVATPTPPKPVVVPLAKKEEVKKD